MSLAKFRKEYYLAQKENKDKNILNGIPIHSNFSKLGSIIPSIPRGYQILWTANSGVGKSTSCMGLFVYTVYKLKKSNPDIKIKLIIALLEDTKEMFVDRLYSMLLFELFGIRVDIFDLYSLKSGSLSKDLIAKLDIVEKEIEFLLNDCEIIDSIYNPTGLYKWARTISSKYGTHHNKTMMFTSEDGFQKEHEVYSHFEQHNSNQQFLFIVDNLNNLSQEMREGRLLSERETINMWSRSYCRLQITKHWKFTVINIIQQASDSEKQQFDYKGNSVIEKIKPSIDGIGNSKECARDHFLIFGLFAPNRYGIRNYSGYNIDRLGDNFRSLIILKSNLSSTNIEIPLFFDGMCSKIDELPSDRSMTETIYKNIEKLRQ